MTTTYDVMTDMDPQTVTAVSREIYRRWVDFALGRSKLGINTLMHPTGRYASSIQFKRWSATKISVFTDDNLAPEAEILEHGHGPIDLKKKLQPGKAYPMHRGREGQFGSAGYGKPVLNRTVAGRMKNIWARPRARGFTGFARVPTKITAANATSWIIPRMPAYAPAQYLVDLIRQAEVLTRK